MIADITIPITVSFLPQPGLIPIIKAIKNKAIDIIISGETKPINDTNNPQLNKSTQATIAIINENISIPSNINGSPCFLQLIKRPIIDPIINTNKYIKYDNSFINIT